MGGGSGSAVIDATRSCLARDRSLVLRTYAVVGSLLATGTALLIVLALPTWIAQTTGASATLMLGQGMLILGGLAVIVVVVLPLLLAARRLPEPGAEPVRERIYGAVGFAVGGAVYVSLVISAPPEARSQPPAAIAPLVDRLYALDPVFAILPPLAVLALLLALDRRFVR